MKQPNESVTETFLLLFLLKGGIITLELVSSFDECFW